MISCIINGRYFNSVIPCPSTNEGWLKPVIILKRANQMFCLFDYSIVWICSSLPTKDVYKLALACICNGKRRLSLQKEKLKMEHCLEETWSICSRTFSHLIKWKAERECCWPLPWPLIEFCITSIEHVLKCLN